MARFTWFRRQSSSGGSLQNEDLEEECIQELLKFTREVIYGDFHSDTMGKARAMKWRSQKKKSFCRLPPDEDCLRNHVKRANYLAYLLRNPSLKDHPSPLGKGWELVNGLCRPVRHHTPALPDYLSGNVDDVHVDVNNNGEDEESDIDSDKDKDNSDNEYDDIDSSTDEDFSDIESD